jgi:hypothetical protein
MRFQTLALATFCAVTALAAVAPPAFADDDWRWHERHERREREAWREREWRGHEWRERYYRPPVVVAPPYGFYAPPPAFYPPPGSYR